MQRHFPVTGISFLCGETSWDAFSSRPFASFDSASLAFLKELSSALMGLSKSQPNLASLGFFIRPNAVLSQKRRLAAEQSIGRGLSFHLSPSNVATVAVYSWVTSLLAGCPSIVRLSSRITDEQAILLSTLSNVLVDHPQVRDRVRFVQYPHSDELNQRFSELSANRVMWGGDKTLEVFQRYSVGEEVNDLCFADRRSYAIVDLDYWSALKENEQLSLLSGIAVDIATYGQKACSSPILVLTMGDVELVDEFFIKLSTLLSNVEPSFPNVIEQQISTQLLSLKQPELRLKRFGNWQVCELPVPILAKGVKPENGHLLHWHAQKGAIESFGFSAAPQTCVMLCDKEDRAQLKKRSLADRFVSPGQALVHDWVWDGIDLIAEQTDRK
ncbi:acyl-CoA reductase [Aliagarivorans marinus]|uniref:acyl-CoA reductase n=1 Tax=Aliagarivorans marinus TaxID=561965 RepID=UPI000410FA2B|nr:acyl-CoA reductase [Aliagarivorans marinus]